MRKHSSKFSAEFDEEWRSYWKDIPENMRDRIRRKIDQILSNPKRRHMRHGLDFFVAEVGQYRVVYRVFEASKAVRFYFVGKHKDYERWYRK